MTKQQSPGRRGSHRQLILGALVAGGVLSGMALHLSAEPTHADCLSINGSSITMTSGNACSSSSPNASTLIVAPGSVVSSSSQTTPGASAYAQANATSGDATAVAQSGSNSGDAVAVAQSSDNVSTTAISSPAGTLSADQILINGSACGAPSIVMNVAGISLSVPDPAAVPCP
jgi:hypothetical protein